MPFVQFKLDESINQSRDIYNKYIYETSDLDAEVTGVGYFSESRFFKREPDKWKGSIIEAKTGESYLVLMIDDTGTGTSVLLSS